MQKKPEEDLVFSRCANPDCSAPFSYRQGQLFRFETSNSGSPAAPANAKSVRHFWLCKCCSETHGLEFHKDHGLLLVVRGSNVLAPKQKSRVIAAA